MNITGERGGRLWLPSFKDAVRLPLLRVLQLVFALFC